jgi:hypothetical protein
MAIKQQTRAVIAFIAGELIARHGSKKIYDYSSGAIIPLEARMDRHDVDVTDKKAEINIAGGAFGNVWTLYHYSERYQIDLTIEGHSFKGTDRKSRTHFKGHISDMTVTLIEDDTLNSPYAYRLM